MNVQLEQVRVRQVVQQIMSVIKQVDTDVILMVNVWQQMDLPLLQQQLQKFVMIGKRMMVMVTSIKEDLMLILMES